jgi:hypothetical protein
VRVVYAWQAEHLQGQAARIRPKSRYLRISSVAQRVRRAHPRINPGTNRAALRFARVPQ